MQKIKWVVKISKTRDDTPKRSEMDAEDMENHQNEKEKGNKKSGIAPKKFMKKYWSGVKLCE